MEFRGLGFRAYGNRVSSPARCSGATAPRGATLPRRQKSVRTGPRNTEGFRDLRFRDLGK